MRTQGAGIDAAAAADSVHRLAVLLQAGVPPARAWQYLARSGDAAASAVVAAMSADAPGAAAHTAAIRRLGGAWEGVASAWHVATVVGAPLAESLRAIAAALRDAAEAADQVRVALAEPTATARLMGWLPLVAVALGAAFGFDTLTVVATHPLGVASVGGGLVLLIVARRWTSVLVRRAQPPPGVPGLHAELMAIALSGGVSIERARTIVAGSEGADDDASTDGVLELSRTAGVPAAELLRASAAQQRHRARTEGRLRAARMASRLLLPLGACTLPAFLLLGVAPMLLSVLTTTHLTL